MTTEKAQIVIGNIPIKPEALDDCYDITEYQEAKTIAIKALETLDKLDSIIVEQLDKSTDQKECMTLRWVLDKMSEVI